jgi:phage/plasmid-like protein (TIGR03299 family)
MSALFEQGFFVRVPAWHGEGIVPADYPGREEAMRLAGHDWDVVELPLAGLRCKPDGAKEWRVLDGYVEHLRSDNGFTLRVGSDSFERIPNGTAYDVAELLLDQGFEYETGITLDGGKLCAITLLLDEPIQITGDDSPALPYVGLSWAHDGSASLKLRSTSVRQVCANTVAASEAEGKKLGTDFTFRHTKNVKDRIEDAKKAIQGVREGFSAYVEAMEELGTVEVTPAQRDLFISEIIGDKGGVVSLSASTSDRVKNNIEGERAKIGSLFFGPTIPEAHKLTGYGLHLAGVEYFDHLRAYRSKDSYVKRTLLSDNPAKASLARTIRELVAA